MFSKLQAHLDMIMAVEPQQSRALYQGTFTESRAMLVDNPRLHSLADPVHLWSYTLRHKKTHKNTTSSNAVDPLFVGMYLLRMKLGVHRG